MKYESASERLKKEMEKMGLIEVEKGQCYFAELPNRSILLVEKVGISKDFNYLFTATIDRGNQCFSNTRVFDLCTKVPFLKMRAIVRSYLSRKGGY